MDKITRRSFVTTVGAATVVPAGALLSPAACAAPGPVPPNAANAPDSATTTYLFFNAAEVLFIEAACERLIPATH
jgi:hypothetical protein